VIKTIKNGSNYTTKLS